MRNLNYAGFRVRDKEGLGRAIKKIEECLNGSCGVSEVKGVNYMGRDYIAFYLAGAEPEDINLPFETEGLEKTMFGFPVGYRTRATVYLSPGNNRLAGDFNRRSNGLRRRASGGYRGSG